MCVCTVQVSSLNRIISNIIYTIKTVLTFSDWPFLYINLSLLSRNPCKFFFFDYHWWGSELNMGGCECRHCEKKGTWKLLGLRLRGFSEAVFSLPSTVFMRFSVSLTYCRSLNVLRSSTSMDWVIFWTCYIPQNTKSKQCDASGNVFWGHNSVTPSICCSSNQPSYIFRPPTERLAHINTQATGAWLLISTHT